MPKSFIRCFRKGALHTFSCLPFHHRFLISEINSRICHPNVQHKQLGTTAFCGKAKHTHTHTLRIKYYDCLHNVRGILVEISLLQFLYFGRHFFGNPSHAKEQSHFSILSYLVIFRILPRLFDYQIFLSLFCFGEFVAIFLIFVFPHFFLFLFFCTHSTMFALALSILLKKQSK